MSVSLMLVNGPRTGNASSGGGLASPLSPDGHDHPPWREALGRGRHETTLPCAHDADWGLRTQLYTEICQTQALYAGFASRTAISHKVLKHVPVSLIRDLFLEFSAKTGFGACELSKDDLDAVTLDKAKGGGVKEGKEFFLMRLVQIIVSATGNEQLSRDMPAKKLLTDVILRHHLLRELYRAAFSSAVVARSGY
mmetsp:Transcript_123477/g.394932  ORF Transcript_123477/g.394932 Transcript_123477/m.394932 type:complete len:195 (+) Transcript_123477:41-625(+)